LCSDPPLAQAIPEFVSRKAWLAPRVLIQEIRADGRVIWEPPSPRWTSELASSSAMAALRLPLGVRTIEVSFAALSFASSQFARCQCRVDGLDRDWIDLNGRHQAGFTNLAPHLYRFRLRTAQTDGRWAPEEAGLSFLVLPNYWQTWWFRSSVGTGLAAGLAWLCFWRISNLQRQHALHQSFAQRLIQSQESERQRIAADLHDSLGQKLLIIKNCAQFGLTEVARPSEVKEQLERVSSFASESLEEIRQIAYNLRPYQLDQIGLTRAVRSLAAQVEQASLLKVRLDLDSLDGLFPGPQQINIYRILQEGLNNVVRHAEATEVKLVAENRGAELLRLWPTMERAWMRPALAGPASASRKFASAS
jgi:signal transduction histidine kinase